MSQFCTCTGSCRKKAGSKLGDGWVCVLESTHALMEVGASNNWRPISTAPKDGTRVLLWCPLEADHPWIVGRMSKVTGEWVDDRTGWLADFSDGGPTHWQPLPPPPAAVSEPSWNEPAKCPHGMLKGLCAVCSMTPKDSTEKGKQ